jgi:hypothetical protein
LNDDDIIRLSHLIITTSSELAKPALFVETEMVTIKDKMIMVTVYE